MTRLPARSPACLLLTATIQVKQDLVFTARKDTATRLRDYVGALTRWLAHPDVQQVVFVENSGYDLAPLQAIASRVPHKTVEFVSFTAPPFDGALGKGYGEMLCLQHALQHSTLLATASRFVKVTGRYFLANASQFLGLLEQRPDADAVCDLLLNLSWADSRVFAGSTDFLHRYLFPLRDQVNDSQGVNFEHVLARAVHACMADGGTWIEPPFPLLIEGVSGSQGRPWQMSLKSRLAQRIRHRLFARFLATGPS